MRLLRTPLLALSLFSLPWLSRPQDPLAQEDDELVPPSQQELRASGLEQALDGTWLLLDFESADPNLELLNVQGFAMFDRGLLSFQIQGLSTADTLFGEATDLWVQAELQRYRVDELGRLQTASMFGFNNINEDGQIEPIPLEPAREHEIHLDGDFLTLRRLDGTQLHFTRMQRDEFPLDAILYLDRTRDADADFYDVDDGIIDDEGY